MLEQSLYHGRYGGNTEQLFLFLAWLYCHTLSIIFFAMDNVTQML